MAASLKQYNNKRDFSKTTEPKPKMSKQNKNRFVIQYHKARKTHYDFRLEYNNVLVSFAVPKGLSQNPNDKRLAVHVEDHPVDYINFEGVIPKGNYGAGSVEIFDSGTYVQLKNFDEGFEYGHIRFVLFGKKVKGGFDLFKIDNKNWIIKKIDDEFADKDKQTTKNSLPFKKVMPQLATLSKTIPKGKNWIFEIKYDGYRMLSFVENQKVQLFSRNQQSFNQKFEHIAKSLQSLQCDNFVLDGEVVVFDENGRSDFSLLTKSIRQGKKNQAYVVFDILAYNGEDLTNQPLKKRKKKLDILCANADKNIIVSSYIEGKGRQCFEFAKDNNLEGIVAKNINSTYVQKRTEDWLKIKCYNTAEFVVCGYTSRPDNILKNLVLGYYNNKQLTYVGKVGSGISEKTKVELLDKFENLKTKTCQFESLKKEKIIWLKPKLVAQIKFVELTKDKILRQPSYICLRQDKCAKDVVLEGDGE